MQFVTNLFSGGKGILSSFDKFASSYSAPKKTNKGAVFSLLIHAISFGYFGFLAYQFSSNQIEPAFAFVQQMNFHKHSLDLTQDLFGFQYFSSTDGSLDDIQASKGEVYLLFEVHFYDHETGKNTNIPLIKCKNHPDVEQYYCPDFSQVKGSDGLNLHLITVRQPKTEVILTAKRCTGLANCATSNEIDLLLSQQSYFDIVTFAKQYNHISMAFETVYIQETYYFDTNLGINSKIKVISADTNVYDGYLTSTKSLSNSGPYDYTRLDSYNSQQLLTLENNSNSLLYLSFDLDTFSVKLDIQFPTLMTLVPVAISLGEIVFVILRTILPDFSKNVISSEVMKANLKGSFAKTALQMFQLDKQQKEEAGEDRSKGQEAQGKASANSDGSKVEGDTDKDEKKAINKPEDVFQKLEEYEQQSKNILNLIVKSVGGDWESIIALVKKIIPCLKKKVNAKTQEIQDKIKSLQKESTPEQDISTSIEDILFLKKAVSLLLTKEQFAAIHFCGSEFKPSDEEEVDNSSNKPSKNQISPEVIIPMNQLNENINYNHLEEVESIKQSQAEMMRNFKNYISQTKDTEKNKNTELDKRILGSLIFDINSSPPNTKLENETNNGSGSPGLVSSLLPGRFGKMMPDVLKQVPGVSDALKQVPGMPDANDIAELLGKEDFSSLTTKK